MTAPVDAAYAALADALADALVESGFINTTADLNTDPEGPCEPTGDEDSVQTSAQLFRLQTTPVRPLMGGGAPRYVVDLGVHLETAVFGQVADGQPSHRDRLSAMLDAVAVIPGTDPTLGQTCERLLLQSAGEDDLAPNGLKILFEFTLRLRAGDELGRTAP